MRWFAVAGCAWLLLLASCADVPDDPPEPSPPAMADTVTPTPPPVGSDEPVAPLPEVSVVMERGQRVAYSVCSRVTGWQKPDIAGMAQVFTDRRFGDGERPFPVLYALYLKRAYYIAVPTANSANKENVAFSAQWAVGEAGERFCDFQALRNDPLMQMLYLDGYHMQEMRYLNGHFVVVVEPAPGVREDVVFNYPEAVNALPVRDMSLRVVDMAGAPVYEMANSAGTSLTAQYGAGGRVVAMTLSGDVSFTSWPVAFAEGQQPLRMFSAFAPPTSPPVPAGTLTLLGALSTPVLTVAWPQQAGGWQQLATLEVPPGSYEIRVDVPCPGGSCSYVLIAEDVPLP